MNSYWSCVDCPCYNPYKRTCFDGKTVIEHPKLQAIWCFIRLDVLDEGRDRGRYLIRRFKRKLDSLRCK